MKHLPHTSQLLHKSVLSGLALLVIDGLVFTRTDATKVASYVVVVGFVLLLATIYGLVYQLLRLIGLYGLVVRRKTRLTAYLTAFAACTLALQSVGELSPRDVLVLLPLVLISYVYTTYAKGDRRNLDG